MNKLKMQTSDLTAQNIEKIAELFPNCITETVNENGQPKRAVNFSVLKQMLSGEVLDGDEAYEFTWVGKKASIVEANRPIRKTLRPCIEESRNWDSTENLYIEGDNLEVLKLLQESYLGKVKMIYIDPPYNTGNDFIYRDDFKQSAAEYDEESGVFDEEENRLFKNTDSNGRFHSDWCSMIYPRLMLARNLLSDDGVIFISIDDNEVAQMRKICDDVFGESNFVGLMTILSNPRGSQNSKNLSYVHEYLFMYAKQITELEIKGINKSEENISEFSEVDGNGKKYRLLGLRKRGGAWRKEDRPMMFYPIFVNPETGEVSLKKSDSYYIEVIPKRPTGELSRWSWGKDKFLAETSLLIGKPINRKNEPNAYDIFRKDYLESESGEIKTAKVKTIWVEKETNYQNAKNEIKALFGNSEMFDFPKPTYIVSKLAEMLFDDDDIILDFFSGSATTAHAVMQLNAEDGGNRKFIMVQLPEPCDEKSEAYKAGYKNICEIGKERIRRAGDKIKTETGADIDYGFRVFKVDESNMNDIYYSVAELNQTTLASTLDNIKADRSALDLLFGCLLDWGLPLSMPYKSEQLGDCTVHTYNEGDLVACFDTEMPEEVLVEIAKRQPLRAVFRDSCFADSPAKINVFEIFKLYAPDCTVKVL